MRTLTPKRKTMEKVAARRARLGKRVKTVYVDDDLRAELGRRVRASDGLSGQMRLALNRYYAMLRATLDEMEDQLTRGFVTKLATHYYDDWLLGHLDPVHWVHWKLQPDDPFAGNERRRMRGWTAAQRVAVLDLLERAWTFGPEVIAREVVNG